MSQSSDNSTNGARGQATGQKTRKALLIFMGSDQIIRYLPLLLLLIIIVILGASVPHFLTTRNIINVLRQSSALGLMAIGMTAVLIGGGIDLSIPAIMALGGILGAMYMRAGGDPVFASIIMVGTCTCAGAVNGYVVAYLRMIPFVVTLSMMYIATGASIWLTKEVSVAGLHPAFLDTVMSKVWIIPTPVLALLIITAVVVLMMRNSIYGRWLYAVGANPEVARSLGIPKNRIILGTYVFGGFFAGLAAIITTARLMSASATMGAEGIVLSVISAAVVGGVSVYGGVGSPLGAVIGAVFITMISNTMNMMHVSYFMTLFIKGCVIVSVVALDSLRRGRRNQ
jgi:ribose/xylose/arabinose/galactoside ABC-type transport system permease subunit